jgi:hypothetical protein
MPTSLDRRPDRQAIKHRYSPTTKLDGKAVVGVLQHHKAAFDGLKR